MMTKRRYDEIESDLRKVDLSERVEQPDDGRAQQGAVDGSDTADDYNHEGEKQYVPAHCGRSTQNRGTEEPPEAGQRSAAPRRPALRPARG